MNGTALVETLPPAPRVAAVESCGTRGGHGTTRAAPQRLSGVLAARWGGRRGMRARMLTDAMPSGGLPGIGIAS